MKMPQAHNRLPAAKPFANRVHLTSETGKDRLEIVVVWAQAQICARHDPARDPENTLTGLSGFSIDTYLEVTLLTSTFASDTIAEDRPFGSSGQSVSGQSPLKPEAPATRTAPDVETVLKTIVESLEDSKAEEIVTIDIAGRSSLADAMIIASGRSHRHVGAIADHLDKKLRELGVKQLRIDGLPHCDWVLVDAGDAMVHLFRPEVRSFYNLEKMWEVEVPAPKPGSRAIVRG